MPDVTIGKAEPLVQIEERKAVKKQEEADRTNITIGGQRYVAKQKNNYVPSKEALAGIWKEEQAAISKEKERAEAAKRPEAPLIIWTDDLFEPVKIGEDQMSIQAVEAPQVIDSVRAPTSSSGTDATGLDGEALIGGYANKESNIKNVLQGHYTRHKKG